MRMRCGRELFTHTCAELRLHDPLAVAHSQLSTVLADTATTFGIYSVSPATSLQVLADLRMLSARLLAVIPLDDVDDFLGANRWCSIRERVIASGMDLARWRRAAEFTARAPALITGIGIALSLKILEPESIHEAGNRLRGVVGRRGYGREPTPRELRFGRLSPALEAVCLSAISAHFTPSNKLRFRIMTELPRYPDSHGASEFRTALQTIPSALWRDWTLRLVARQRLHIDNVASSLSVLLLIIGTRMTVDEAVQHLGGEVTGKQQMVVLDWLHRNPLWSNIATAIIRLHDYLFAKTSPIDYQRRRQLDYEDLLTTDVWARICQSVGFNRNDSTLYLPFARAWLFERLSSRPGGMSPFVQGIPRAQDTRDKFVERFTPGLVAAFDDEAEQFLKDHNIFDEPVWWVPPLSIVADLELPGPDPDNVSIPELHRVLRAKGMTLYAAAKHFEVPSPVIRLLLERFPMEGSGTSHNSWKSPRQVGP